MVNYKELIIFDFFGVICSEVSPFWLRKYFDENKAKEIHSKIVSLVDYGSITEDELYEKLGELANVSPETVRNEWQELIIVNDKMVDFIKSIKKDFKVALLSNASSTFVRRIIDNNNLNELFDVILISSEEKMVKPNVEFFNLLLNKINVKPENSVMIDDNPINLDGAKKAGIDGILFRNYESFVTDFKNMINN